MKFERLKLRQLQIKVAKSDKGDCRKFVDLLIVYLKFLIFDFLQ